jgi:hypothetical protein
MAKRTAVATMPPPDELVRSIAALTVAEFAEVVRTINERAGRPR